MVETNWTREQATEAADCVAKLKELHAELADALDDDPRRDDLWAQIEDEHTRFATLMADDQA